MAANKPQTLDEVILLSLTGPIKDIHEKTYQAIKEFLATKFADAQLDFAQHKECEEELQRLFNECVRRK